MEITHVDNSTSFVVWILLHKPKLVIPANHVLPLVTQCKITYKPRFCRWQEGQFIFFLSFFFFVFVFVFVSLDNTKRKYESYYLEKLDGIEMGKNTKKQIYAFNYCNWASIFFCLVKFYCRIFLGYILINLFFFWKKEKVVKFFDNFFNFS